MNASNAGQRYRGPSNGQPVGPGSRLGQDFRHGVVAPDVVPAGARVGGPPSRAQMSETQKFEDDRRRIIDSVFSKKDPDGSSPESYITHLRIEEDADHPSSPAPFDSPPSNKKPRVILVAVKKSGRVRMHKARENADATFSIGKTWALDDLSRIESFTNAVPRTPEELQNKQRAGATGFIITLGKPYYWRAATAKEKDYFIFSITKIFRKYTGGKLPELVGFTPQDLDHFGVPEASSTASPPSNQPSQVPSAAARISGQDPPPARAPRVDGPHPGSRVPGQDPAPLRPPQTGMHPAGSRFPSQDPPPIRPPRADIPLTGSRIPSQDPPPIRPPRADINPTGSRIPSQDPPTLRPSRPDAPSSETSRERRLRPAQEREVQERPLHSSAQPAHRVLHSAASKGQSLRKTGSSDRLHLPGSFPSTESIPLQTPPPQLRPDRSPSPDARLTTPASSMSRAPSENRHVAPGRYEQDQSSMHSAATGRSSSEQSRRNGAPPSGGRHRATSQQSGSADERPRTAAGDDHAPSSALAIPSPKPKRPSSPTDPGLQSDRSNPVQTSDLTTGGGARSGSSQGRHSDRAYGAAVGPQYGQARSSSNLPSTKLPSRDAPADRSVQPQNAGPTASVSAEVPLMEPPSSTVPPTLPPDTPSEREVHRPGLGPMIKKKSQREIASQFRKAATAYNAFKPRAGGAAVTAQDDKNAGGDGITGVFQAPSALRGIGQDEAGSAAAKPKEDARLPPPVANSDVPPPSVPDPEPRVVQDAGSAPKPPVPPRDERRKRPRSDHSARYAKALGIAPALLEGRTFEIEAVLDEFDGGEGRDRATLEDVQAGTRKELARAEAGVWLGAGEDGEHRWLQVSEMIDKVVVECQDLYGELNLYNNELGTLRADVAYIEAQSQGLQVQTANQKLLHAELKHLLATISISASDLEVLKVAPLTESGGIVAIETTLSRLYTAMLTIDPKLRQRGARPTSTDRAGSKRAGNTGGPMADLSSMRAVREKEAAYRGESVELLHRLKRCIAVKYRETSAEIFSALNRNRGDSAFNPPQLSIGLRALPKRPLWPYSPLMLFARAMEPRLWEEMLRMYEESAMPTYRSEFQENVGAWQLITRKPSGDEADVLFTAPEKESDGLVGRKLTVKRSKTVRTDGSGRISSGDKPRDGKLTAYEAFAGALTEQARTVFMEQNFVMSFFHLSSLETKDFGDAIATDPEQRRSSDLLTKQPADPDRDMARRVVAAMQEIFGFWSSEIQALADWAIRQDALNVVGILFALESQMAEVEETNQEFLSQVLGAVHDRLAAQFARFVDEQVRAIEDTRVRIKKRTGVIAFVKTFPAFSTALETMLPLTRSPSHLPVRGMVDDAYRSINKAMFDSLMVIAKEAPKADARDPEDKGYLNFRILLFENMNHYVQEVNPRENPVLVEWSARAQAKRVDQLNMYLYLVCHRPLGKLYDFLESTETLLLAHPENPKAIAARPSHSRAVFKKVLSSYDAKELRKGIETLKKRVDKHFGDSDDTPGRSKELVAKVHKACEVVYLDVCDRAEKIIQDVYEGTIEMDWREDVKAAFRR